MKHKDFIEVTDYTADEVLEIFRLAADLKKDRKKYRSALEGQTLAMIFEKSSTRTRVSFEVGMDQLGGHALFLSSRDIQLGRGEPITDTARVLSRYVDGIMARTFAHKTVTDLAEYATVPVINGLTDLSHPCQSMTDYFTAWEKFGGELKGRKMAYVGDGNNMAHSLLVAAPKVGMDIAVATPADYAPNPEVVAGAGRRARCRHEGDRHHVDGRGHPGRRRRRDRRLGVDGTGGRGGEAQPRLPRLDGRRAPHDLGEKGRHLHALPPRPPRRGSGGRGDRQPRVRNL
jgi:ornithine carbamoyltransferase